MARGDYYSGADPNRRNSLSPVSNPFQAVTQGQAIQSDPWQGLRAPGQTPFAQQGTAAMQPTSRVPAYSPLTDPQGPLARAGWIGALLAQGPTKAEVLAQKLGQGQQQAMTVIGQRMQAGMSPQRAILDFANSPEGVEFFTNGGGFTDLANMAKGLTPPVEEGVVMSAGQQLRSPTTGALIAGVPTTEEQKFNAMAQLAGLSDDEKKQLAQATMLKDTTGDLSAAEAAMARLVQGGRVDQQTGDLIIAGVLTPKPILDEAGKTIGYGIVDMSNPSGGITQLPANGQAAGTLPKADSRDFAAGVTPGTAPEEQPDNGPIFEGMADPADVVDASGPIGWLIEKLGPIYGNFDPANAPNDTVQKRQILGRIRADANNLGNNGRMLKQEQEDLRSLSDTLQVMTSPVITAQKLLGLHDQYDNLERRLNDITMDPKATATVKGNALIDISNIQRARSNLPTRDSLKAKMSKLQAQQPGEAIGQAITEGEQLGEKAVTDVQGQPPAQAKQPQGTGQTYNTMAEVTEAWKAGKLRKGMTVTVGGKTYPVTADPPEMK